MGDVTVSEVARRVDVSPGTLRRWVREGIVPLPAGAWTPAAIAHARMVARLRDRGHSLEQIREASSSGRLAYSYMEQLFGAEAGTCKVMVVGTDAGALADWAVEFQAAQDERPLPRIGMHRGAALYRDGDYYGRAVNLGARAAGGEVLVTREVVEAAGRGLGFDRIGEVKLKGFDQATELYLAQRHG